MTALPDAGRVLGAVALLLAFGLLAGGRWRAPLYAAQCAIIALASLWQAIQAPVALAPGLLGVTVILSAQAAWLLPGLRRAVHPRLGAPAPILAVALLLVVVATATAPAAVTAALSVVLIGLLGAAATAGPFGALCLLNGAALALLAAPGLPSRLLLVLALAGLAVLVGDDGAAWPRLRLRLGLGR